MEDAPDPRSRVCVWVPSVSGGYQDAIPTLAQLAHLGGVVVSVAQNEASLLRQLFEQPWSQATVGFVGRG